jgi:predicted CXXCH cytochrome family protein
MAFAAGVEILTPRPASTIFARNPATHLVLRQSADGGARRLKVKSGNVIIDPSVEMQDEGKDYLHFRLPLVPGVNTFTILPGGEQFEVKYQAINAAVPPSSSKAYLFHQDEQLPKSCTGCHELRETSIIERLGLEAQESCAVCHQDILKTVWQHSPASSKLCLTCHQQSVKPWRIGFPSGKIEDICFACHNSKSVWRSRKYIHGPLVAGGCTLCHNPHGGDNRNYLWAENALELCVTCHNDKDHLLSKEQRLPYVHGLGVSCVMCHDPHATDNIFVLKQPINKLCVGCHYQLNGIDRGHPVGGHPLAGTKELRRPGRELSCASCHDPHGSSYVYMLIGEPMDGHLCRVCHKK